MNLVSGGLIEVQDYNDIALEVNRLFSDNTVDLKFSSSNLILDYTVTGSTLGSGTNIPFNSATLDIKPGDLIAVEILLAGGGGWFTVIPGAGFNVNIAPNPKEISFTRSYDVGTRIRAWWREAHTYGWGQQASVYPVNVGDPVLADEATLQAYLEANVNNLIDKVNIMEERTGGPSELTRVAQGQLIYATDKTTITNTIDTDILPGNNYWQNEVATVQSNVFSFSRDTPWTNRISAEVRFTWSSYDEFRYFFNSGCDLRTTLVTSGDTSSQGFINWTSVINDMGSLIVNYNEITQSGSGGSGSFFGSYQLTESYQLVFTSNRPTNPVSSNPNEYSEYDEYTDFSDLRIRWAARVVDDQPNTGEISLDVRVVLDDTEYPQSFDGTIEMQAGYLTADDITDNSAAFSINSYLPTITKLQDFVVDGFVPTASNEIGVIGSGGFADGDVVGTELLADGGDVVTRIAPTILGNSGIITYDASTTIFVDSTESFSTTGTLKVNGVGIGDTASLEITFEPEPGLSVSPSVQNVSFRISDIDGNGPQEYIIVEAFDEVGDSVAVTFTEGANLTVASDTVSATATNGTPALAAHSVLVQVAGPVRKIEITAGNSTNDTHEVYLSDIAYTTIPI